MSEWQLHKIEHKKMNVERRETTTKETAYLSVKTQYKRVENPLYVKYILFLFIFANLL